MKLFYLLFAIALTGCVTNQRAGSQTSKEASKYVEQENLSLPKQVMAGTTFLSVRLDGPNIIRMYMLDTSLMTSHEMQEMQMGGADKYDTAELNLICADPVARKLMSYGYHFYRQLITPKSTQLSETGAEEMTCT